VRKLLCNFIVIARNKICWFGVWIKITLHISRSNASFWFVHIVLIVLLFFFTQRQVYSGYSDGYTQNHKDESHQDLSKVPGTPGVDYPIYHAVPETSFNCKDVPYAPGMYANVETGCQVQWLINCKIYGNIWLNISTSNDLRLWYRL